MLKSLLAVAITVVLAGTAAAASPTVEAPKDFAEAPAVTEHGDRVDAAFWRRFGDATLVTLIERARAHNHDLRSALANLDAAGATLRADRLDQFPSITAEASAGHRRSSADQAPGQARDARDHDDYSLGARLSWEIDLSGRVRKRVAAGTAEVEAATADLAALRISIDAAVARDYLELRGLQARLAVARENERSQSETLRLVEAGLAAGRGTEFDTSRAASQLSGTRARIPALSADITAHRNRLAVLTGVAPERFDVDVASVLALPTLPAAIDPGTPGDLLLRRPDLAAAAARLDAATARLGVARADYFPHFSLGALLGVQANHGGDLFQRDGQSRLVALGIDWTFLDVARVRAGEARARASVDGAVANYEKALLTALADTETALSGYSSALQEASALDAAASHSGAAAKLARIRYDAGASTLFEVLDAERSKLAADDAAAQGRTRSYLQLVALYQALAGAV